MCARLGKAPVSLSLKLQLKKSKNYSHAAALSLNSLGLLCCSADFQFPTTQIFQRLVEANEMLVWIKAIVIDLVCWCETNSLL